MMLDMVRYGVDVGAVRLDDLDKRVLAHVRMMVGSGQTPAVLDVGCGSGALSLALAQAGAVVTALDIADYQLDIEKQCSKLVDVSPHITFVHTDIRSYLATESAKFDIVVMQRMLHYLPYRDAVSVLATYATQSAHLYLSVTGMTTAIATHYRERDKSLSTRWGSLDGDGQRLFSITAPLCLYTTEEIIATLEQSGWTVAWSRVSDFGNIKITARPL